MTYYILPIWIGLCVGDFFLYALVRSAWHDSERNLLPLSGYWMAAKLIKKALQGRVGIWIIQCADDVAEAPQTAPRSADSSMRDPEEKRGASSSNSDNGIK